MTAFAFSLAVIFGDGVGGMSVWQIISDFEEVRFGDISELTSLIILTLKKLSKDFMQDSLKLKQPKG